jgi:hypothetical protein
MIVAGSLVGGIDAGLLCLCHKAGRKREHQYTAAGAEVYWVPMHFWGSS